jgi:glycosyltransferase involved in cell wall biosynthesis
MHVALNGYFWNQPHTGSGQYTRQLIYHLNRLVSDLEITLVFPQPAGSGPPEKVPPSVRVHSIPLRPGHLGKVHFEQLAFPRICHEIKATVAHVPYWGPPLRSPVPLVVTVHDLATVLLREYRRGWGQRLYNALVTAGARGADHIITDSLSSKQDIIRHLGIPAEKITPIYLAAGPQYKADSEFLLDMAVLRKYELPDFYILYLGGYGLHKNVTTLLHAFTYVAQALGEDYPLVLAGRKPDPANPNLPDYADYIRRSNLVEDVRWIGFVEEEDKPALYRGAMCFVFPSRFEGFGLPPLEAMACGVPVVTTTATSLPEVVGDAAFTVEPDDARGMAGAIISTVIQDQFADKLRQKGIEQAAKFNWEKTATATLLIYDQVGGG